MKGFFEGRSLRLELSGAGSQLLISPYAREVAISVRFWERCFSLSEPGRSLVPLLGDYGCRFLKEPSTMDSNGIYG